MTLFGLFYDAKLTDGVNECRMKHWDDSETSKGPVLNYYSFIRIEELRKTTKNLSPGSQSPAGIRTVYSLI